MLTCKRHKFNKSNGDGFIFCQFDEIKCFSIVKAFNNHNIQFHTLNFWRGKCHVESAEDQIVSGPAGHYFEFEGVKSIQAVVRVTGVNR